MDAGELSKRISIVKLSSQLDKVNYPVAIPTVIATVWAKIQPLQGFELIAAQKVFPKTTYQVTIRYRDGVSEEMIVYYKGRTLQILGVMNQDEDDTWLVLSCCELRDKGENG